MYVIGTLRLLELEHGSGMIIGDLLNELVTVLGLVTLGPVLSVIV